MIQINLLREPTSRQSSWAPSKARPEVWVGLLAALAVVFVLGWHWQISSQKDEAVVRRAELQQQSLQLAAVRNEMKKYQLQKTKLEERAQVIEDLRASQKGPVQMLNAIMEAMPLDPRLWLTSLAQQENSVVIEGNAFDVPAIADFIANLSKNPPFQTVELTFWEDRQDSVAFALNCKIKPQ